MANTDTTTMADTSAKNGRGSSSKPRRMKSIATTSAASDMADASYAAKVEAQSVDWASLENFATFSTSPDGSFPKVKSSKSSYIDIRSKSQECDIASGRVYRVYF